MSLRDISKCVCKERDPGSIPELERSPGERNGKEPHGWRSMVGYSPWGHKESDRTERLHLEMIMGFSCGSPNESACNTGDLGLISELGRAPREWKGYLLQYSGLENSLDCMVHGVTKSWTQLGKFHFHFQR